MATFYHSPAAKVKTKFLAHNARIRRARASFARQSLASPDALFWKFWRFGQFYTGRKTAKVSLIYGILLKKVYRLAIISRFSSLFAHFHHIAALKCNFYLPPLCRSPFFYNLPHRYFPLPNYVQLTQIRHCFFYTYTECTNRPFLTEILYLERIFPPNARTLPFRHAHTTSGNPRRFLSHTSTEKDNPAPAVAPRKQSTHSVKSSLIGSKRLDTAKSCPICAEKGKWK